MPLSYTFPKIYKKGTFPPGRPILTTCGTALEPIAQFVDSFLQPFIVEDKSYVKDTIDFISKAEGLQIPDDAILLTMDIVSLYTNIPLEKAHLSLENCLDRRDNLSPPTHFLMDSLDLIFEHNLF